MSTATQVAVVATAATVFVIRLATALHHSHADSQFGARRARMDQQL